MNAIFRTTHWTQVLQAANPINDTGGSAFAELYQVYWFPLYAYCRRRGLAPMDSEDALQDFFVQLVQKQSFADLQREGGKFRSFLLKCLENFLRIGWRREQAQKRGQGRRPLSLNVEEGESLLIREAVDGETPESEFEKKWAYALLDHVTKELRAEYMKAGKAELFESLAPHLQPDRSGSPYANLAAECGMKEGAIKVAVHRMRHRYGDLLREAIGRTVETAEEIDGELRYLIEVVGR